MNYSLTRLLCAAAILAGALAPSVVAKDTTKSSSSSSHHKSTYAEGVKRDSKGHPARDPKAKEDFMKQSGYPHGRPGYVADHIVPLKRGGEDSPSNMQWQTKADAKAKD